MRCDIERITCATEGRIVEGSALSAEVVGITWDSRAVTKGSAFVALVGQRVDGHDFLPQAFADGAACALVTKDPSEEALEAARRARGAIVMVEDAHRALSDLASWWRTQLSGLVIGITGSTGKTSTKNMVAAVCSSCGPTVATRGNQNNELGVPNTLLSAEADTRFVVVEMGMRGQGQIAQLCAIARPDWALVTNVGESHIELLGSRDAIACAKAEIFQGIAANGLAFVNAADQYADRLIEVGGHEGRGARTVFFDGSPDAAARRLRAGGGAPCVWAENVALDENGCARFDLCATGFPQDGRVACALSVPGLHNVGNACSAAAIGFAAGMAPADIARALSRVEAESGRQEMLRTPRGSLVVNDAYNANPDSMRSSLDMFAALDLEGRRMAVLGDMGELGSFAVECHRRVGAHAASCGLDLIVCVGELARFIAQGAIDAGFSEDRVCCVGSADEASSLVEGLLEPSDAVLIKASHFMDLERIARRLVG